MKPNHRIVLSLLFLSVLLHSTLFAQDPWINEIHYDNDGADVNECIEIAGAAGIDLSCYQIVLYNGSTSQTYDTDALTGLIIDDEGCAYGAVQYCYPANGIQNGAPDGICLYNSCTATVIQFISYEGTITATNGPANGLTSTDIGVNEGGSTLGSSLQLTGSGSSYSDFSWQTEGPASSMGSLNAGQSITPCGPANTLTIDAVSSLSYSVDCTTGDNGTVDFSSSGTFNAGNEYTVELSDASGSFTSPTTIGSLSSTANSGTISFTVPPATVSGSGYRIRIVSSDPSVTSTDNESDITITLTGSCTPPYITSVIINSCQFGGCSEGHNEIVFGNTGDYSMETTVDNVDLYYENTSPASINYTESLTTNATTTADLNTESGCGGLFFEGTNTTIPPNSTFMIVRSTICPGALDWTSLCGSGPIYVIYTDDPTWTTSGNFSNSASGMRYFRTEFTTTNGVTHTLDYDFNSNDLTLHDDGDYVTFSSSGGSATNYDNQGCMLTPVVLGSQMVHFSGKNENDHNILYWQTASETNNDHFRLQHSLDLKNWETIALINGAGNSDMTLNYSVVHDKPSPGINYYQLHSVDFEGLDRTEGTISVISDFEFAYYDRLNGTVNLSYATDIEIYSSDGRLVTSAVNATKIPLNGKGVYLIRDMKNSIVHRLFLP